LRVAAGPALACALAGAAPVPGYPALWSGYLQALDRTCPDRHIDRLSPADLRDALDAYRTQAAPAARRTMLRAETQACRRTVAGAACSNVADLRFLSLQKELPAFARWMCTRR